MYMPASFSRLALYVSRLGGKDKWVRKFRPR